MFGFRAVKRINITIHCYLFFFGGGGKGGWGCSKQGFRVSGFDGLPRILGLGVFNRRALGSYRVGFGFSFCGAR